MPHTRNSSAFTLLEMLVAMSLMSILAASLYASLHIGFRARDSAAAAIGPVRTAQLAIELVRQDIESALPPVGILAAEFIGTDAKDESGRDADTVLFHSSAHNPHQEEAACEIRRVELILTSPSDGSEGALVRLTTTNLLAPETPEPIEEVLCRGVLAFNLRYFDGSEWLDDWDSGAQDNLLPIAVEVWLEVDYPAPTGSETGGYELSCALLLPCGRVAEGQGTGAVRGSAW